MGGKAVVGRKSFCSIAVCKAIRIFVGKDLVVVGFVFKVIVSVVDVIYDVSDFEFVNVAFVIEFTGSCNTVFLRECDQFIVIVDIGGTMGTEVVNDIDDRIVISSSRCCAEDRILD